MSEKAKAIKAAIENGTYDMDKAIETTAEKMVLLLEVFGPSALDIATKQA